jgi:coenzyme F420-reducing hydrogenase alpha subunit
VADARTRTIKADYLARVEGEGAMYVRLRGDEVLDVKLRIYEPPRFFEAFLRGRSLMEATDITARICGICPVAYQTSAAQALEDACGATVDGQLRALRRLIYCGEWIESHGLHVYMLHAPDFMGYESAMEMARDHPEIVERGLRLKKAGNALIALVGGREVHPINVRPGGFYRVPTKAELQGLVDPLERAREDALETVRWAAGLDFPDLELEHEVVALRSETGEYPIDDGRIVSDRGMDIAAPEFDDTFVEEQVPHSNALHCRIRERGSYLAGPLARFTLNFDRLSPLARDAAVDAGVDGSCRNPFQSIVVRSVEILYAFDEALRLIAAYEPPDRAAVELEPRPTVGFGVSEAPRGLLYHRYEIDGEGSIKDARIVPPTSQNQGAIEQDLYAFVARHAGLPDGELSLRCEQAIRNYDPCISCATHFLKLDVERE